MTLAHMLARFREAVGAEPKPTRAIAARKQPRGQASRVSRVLPPSARPAPLPRAIARSSESMRQRIRERYLAVRFPGAPHSDFELHDIPNVIKSARLYFEDGDIDRACELLECAADVNAAEESPWLAHLEILYLKRKGRAFTALAKRFHERFPESARWPEVLRLGLRLEPEEPTYRQAHPREAARDDHYGAWPQVQNWIQAPFDLTGDVLAAEFHAKMRGGDVSRPITAKASGT
jgi:hypothetical protein